MILKEQVAIVTGANRGIGRAIAQGCAEEGAKVALVARTASTLEEVAAEIRDGGGQALAIPTDVTDGASVKAMAKQAEAELGPVDLLVNNAGAFYAIGPTWEVDADTWWSDVTVNLLGVFLCCREVVPEMVARKRGRVINLIGGGTDFPLPYGSAYAAGKAALNMLTRNLAAEFAPRVRVNAISVGGVATDALEVVLTNDALREQFEANTPMGRPGRVEDIAACALYLASPASSWVTGKIFQVDGGSESPSIRVPVPPLGADAEG